MHTAQLTSRDPSGKRGHPSSAADGVTGITVRWSGAPRSPCGREAHGELISQGLERQGGGVKWGSVESACLLGVRAAGVGLLFSDGLTNLLVTYLRPT